MKPKSVQRRILGVDPGTNILGYAVLDTVNDQLHLVQMGVINLSKCKDHQTKLKEIYLQLQEVIECFQPETMAIESPFFGKNVQSMLKLGRAQGVSIAAAITMGLVIEEYSPKMIKQSVTGNGNATKEQVAAMLDIKVHTVDHANTVELITRPTLYPVTDLEGNGGVQKFHSLGFSRKWCCPNAFRAVVQAKIIGVDNLFDEPAVCTEHAHLRLAENCPCSLRRRQSWGTGFIVGRSSSSPSPNAPGSVTLCLFAFRLATMTSGRT